MWGQHDYTGGGAQACNGFTAYIRKSYAEPRGLAEFTRLAQFVAYENHKAMFESVYPVGGNGLLMWMSQSAWPSMVWQTYDYWHDVNGGYYGVKAGNQPRNVIFDPDARAFWAVNITDEDLENVVAHVEYYDINGKLLGLHDDKVALPADSRQRVAALPAMDPEAGILLIRTALVTGTGKRLSQNFTWTNIKEDRNYRALLPLLNGQPGLSDVIIRRSGNGVSGSVTVTNDSDKPQLLVRLTLRDARGNRVLPVHWTDNYVALMPNESVSLSFEATACTLDPASLRVVAGEEN